MASKPTPTKPSASGSRVDTDAQPTGLAHNPFAALASARASLPEAPAGASVTTSKAEAPDPITKALSQKVVVRFEKKGHGGKTVTRVEGVALPATALDAFMREMKKSLGCGAVVDDGAIVLQGELVDRAMAYLQKKGAKRLVRGS